MKRVDGLYEQILSLTISSSRFIARRGASDIERRFASFRKIFPDDWRQYRSDFRQVALRSDVFISS